MLGAACQAQLLALPSRHTGICSWVRPYIQAGREHGCHQGASESSSPRKVWCEQGRSTCCLPTWFGFPCQLSENTGPVPDLPTPSNLVLEGSPAHGEGYILKPPGLGGGSRPVGYPCVERGSCFRALAPPHTHTTWLGKAPSR